MKHKWPSHSHNTYKLNLVDPNFDQHFGHLRNTFDTIFALNVVEHIKDDSLAVLNAKKLLKSGGHLIILVPAYQWMYNGFDTALEHFRRYTKESLIKLVKPHLEVIHKQYFNAFGMLGWFVSGRILKKKTIPRNQMELYDRLIFISKSIDKLVFNLFGLSVIVVSKKA